MTAMTRLRWLCAMLVVTASLLVLAPVASAEAVSRTSGAYDLTQCGCVYSSPSPSAWAYVKSAPLVTVTTYYDTAVVSTEDTYQRVHDSAHYRLLGYTDGLEILAYSGGVAQVVCYTYDRDGRQLDKVKLYTSVNGDIKRWYVVYLPDADVAAYVVDGQHHC